MKLYADPIAEIVNANGNPMAGIWATRKEARVVTLARDVADIGDHLHRLDAQVARNTAADTTHKRGFLWRLRKDILESIAAELGTGTHEVSDGAFKVSVTIEDDNVRDALT